jgi:hypothetical protein
VQVLLEVGEAPALLGFHAPIFEEAAEPRQGVFRTKRPRRRVGERRGDRATSCVGHARFDHDSLGEIHVTLRKARRSTSEQDLHRIHMLAIT